MDDLAALALAWAAGLGLGGVFYGGLWWTVRRSIASRRPALWFLCSLLLRTAIAVAGLLFVSGPHWEKLLACLLGFMMARAVLMWLLRPGRVAQEAGDAA